MTKVRHKLIFEDRFERHYSNFLPNPKSKVTYDCEGVDAYLYLECEELKEGNSPRIFLHKKKVKDLVILTHGLSDSPHYMDEVGKRFYFAGANVFITLLPGHGLIHPQKVVHDPELDDKWKDEIDGVVEIGVDLKYRISLGGFSTGGALSYNKILRNSEMVTGGLFLFASAIDIGMVTAFGQSRILQSIAKTVDGDIQGVGKNPYKYPKLPKFAGIELAQIIEENESMRGGKCITQPVFAAHSINDKTAKLSAVLNLLENYAELGSLFIVSQNVEHASLTLSKDITLNEEIKKGKPAPGNPQFEDMMSACIFFFRKYVQKVKKD